MKKIIFLFHIKNFSRLIMVFRSISVPYVARLLPSFVARRERPNFHAGRKKLFELLKRALLMQSQLPMPVARFRYIVYSCKISLSPLLHLHYHGHSLSVLR